MREAKSLGIPLRQPGTAVRPRSAVRRSSVTQLTEHHNELKSTTDSADVWSCSHCHRKVVDKHTKPTTAGALKLPSDSKTTATASPLRDVFRLLGRKVKDESRSKVTASKTLPRGHGGQCEGCGGEGFPIGRWRTDMSGGGNVIDGCGGGARVKYRRSASTPRPSGDARLHVHSTTTTDTASASRQPARRTHHGQSLYQSTLSSLSLSLSLSLCSCAARCVAWPATANETGGHFNDKFFHV